MPNVTITRSDFALIYQRFCATVQAASPTQAPFVSFRTSLAGRWEQYKFWLQPEARRLLQAETWSENAIGSGRILRNVIQAIEIDGGAGHRNNLLEWQAKGGPPGARSHAKLLAAQTSPSALRPAEAALFRMFAAQEVPQQCFEELARLFGARYDLIAYLFFIRDFSKFTPLRPQVFSQAFALLDTPLKLSYQCGWENYQQALARLREVHRLLSGYNIPGGVELLDAHSFCWMLARLPAPPPSSPLAALHRFTPRAGPPPPPPGTNSPGFSQGDLAAQQDQPRRIGDLAQRHVLRAEQNRLRREGPPDLAGQVRDVSDNPALGYDIESWTTEGAPKPIEVKAVAHRPGAIRFFLSENERLHSRDLANYTFALVTGLESATPRVHQFPGTDLPPSALFPTSYEVRLIDPCGSTTPPGRPSRAPSPGSPAPFNRPASCAARCLANQPAPC